MISLVKHVNIIQEGRRKMNRADRRRLKKFGNVNGPEETTSLNDFIHLYTLSMILSWDTCDVAKEKALEIMEKVYENAECMISGHINQADIETMAAETYGIEFVEGSRNRLYVVGDKIVKV